MTETFAGFSSPNYTQTPNEFYDELVAQIDSMAELKVTLIIMRLTFGFHRTFVRVTFTDLEKLTGLSRPMVAQGVKRALLRRTVKRAEDGAYSLNVRGGSFSTLLGSGKESKPLSGKESKPKLVKNLNRSGVRNGENRPTITGHFAPSNFAKESTK